VASYVLVAYLAVFVWGWHQSRDAYALYRNSVDDEIARVHVATFNTETWVGNYNRGNCEIAASLFQGQPAVETRFWCEKGNYHR
jgi:hypothetical protein